MSVHPFIQKQNVTTLWEVIRDSEHFHFLTRDAQEKVYHLFLHNLHGFCEVESLKTASLVDINKKYILLILSYIQKQYNVQPNKIKIHQEPTRETITYEEIQNERRSQFDRSLHQRQEEFEESMKVKAPPVPSFADKETDTPIKEMDKILKEMQAKRNYEMEQIQQKSNTHSAQEWLTPVETSEKRKNVETKIPEKRFRFLDASVGVSESDSIGISESIGVGVSDSISDSNSIGLSRKKEKKNVSFLEEDDDEHELFSKLKRIQEPTEIGDRMTNVERQIKEIHSKLDTLLEWMKNR